MRKIFQSVGFLLSAVIATSSFAQSAGVECGRPDFNRFEDRGVFVWQNCGTGEWFIRAVSGGGSEVRVTGGLGLTEPIAVINAFNLEFGDQSSGLPDSLDSSDAENINFLFRVFQTAQDGVDFQLQSPPSDELACLRISTEPTVPIIFGQNNFAVTTTNINLATIDSRGCSAAFIVPPIELLLNQDNPAS